jgi:hypothetical protein
MERIVHDETVPAVGECRDRVFETQMYSLDVLGIGWSRWLKPSGQHLVKRVEANVQEVVIQEGLEFLRQGRLPAAGGAVQPNDIETHPRTNTANLQDSHTPKLHGSDRVGLASEAALHGARKTIQERFLTVLKRHDLLDRDFITVNV